MEADVPQLPLDAIALRRPSWRADLSSAYRTFGADAVLAWKRSFSELDKGASHRLTPNGAARFAGTAFFEHTHTLVGSLPPPGSRSEQEVSAAAVLMTAADHARRALLSEHASALYRTLTTDLRQRLRVTEVVTRAANVWPGIVPDREHLDSQRKVPLGEKDDSDRAVGALLSSVLDDSVSGSHLLAAMLLATPRARDLASRFMARGRVDLGAVTVARDDRVSMIALQNPQYLNAEDNDTLSALEVAVDLAFLDAKTDIVLLRGGVIPSGPYAGRRVFGSGLNLTALYNGSLSLEFFIERELGFVHKLLRGVADPDSGEVHFKPVIAVVDGFAIGGACQLLLAVDFVVADREAYFALPAASEGLIPGASNLRLTSHVGVRLAARMLLQGARVEADSSVGALLCDRCVASTHLESAVSDLINTLSTLDRTSMRMNRSAFARSRESFDEFRQYMAFYSAGQAECLASPELYTRLASSWMGGRTDRANPGAARGDRSISHDHHLDLIPPT